MSYCHFYLFVIYSLINGGGFFMNDFDHVVMRHYFKLFGCHLQEYQCYYESGIPYGPSIDELVEVEPEHLIALFDLFIRKLDENLLALEQFSKEQTVEDNEARIIDREDAIISDVCMKAVVYLLSRYEEEYDEIINAVRNLPFYEIVKAFKMGTSLAYCLFKSYICFLVENLSNRLCYLDVVSTINKNPWLRDLIDNKGFDTLNHKARTVLEKMVNVVTLDKNFFRQLDDYFNDFERDGLLCKYATEFTSSLPDIRKFKQYQIRIMLADVYRTLKSYSLDDMQEEETSKLAILEIVEERIFSENYTLPEEETVRHALYRQFYLSLEEKSLWSAQLQTLEEHDCVKILKPVNPLYFLD